MLGPVSVRHRALVFRLQRLEPLLGEVHRIGQIVIVAVAHIDVNLALEFRRQRRPVAGEDV